MEINHNQQEQSINSLQKLKQLSKCLRNLKTLFLQLSRQTSPSKIQTFIESIEQKIRETNQHLEINERKVLKAYVSYHTQNLCKTPSSNYKGQKLCSKQQKHAVYLTFKEKTCSYSNRLFEMFKNWFDANKQLSNGLVDKRKLIITQGAKTQQLLMALSQKIIQNKQIKTQTNQQKSLQSPLCEVTFVLVLTAQLNMCILLLLKKQFSPVALLIQKCKQTHGLLKKHNSSKGQHIANNLETIQKLHNQQQDQVKKFLLSCRKRQLLSHRELKKLDKMNGHHKQNLIQNDQEEAICLKYTKIIDSIIQTNKNIAQQKFKLQLYLKNFQKRLLRVQNCLYFQTNCEITQNLVQKSFQIRLFNCDKLNRALKKNLLKPQQKDNKKNQFNILDYIFQQQSATSKSIYLTVEKNRRNIYLSVKDYFNLCLLLKKIKSSKQAIIYFQILVFHFKKKQFLDTYCLKYFANFHQQNQDSEKQIQQQREKDSKKLLQKFIKNQELLKMLIFSLINLVELYEQQNAYFWSVEVLKYLSEIIQHKILIFLQKLKQNLGEFTKKQENGQSIFSQEASIPQKKCIFLMEYYVKMLQEIKFRIINNSFNSIYSAIPKRQNTLQINIQTLDVFLKSQRGTVPCVQTLRIKKLQQKQNQLKHLIQSKKSNHSLKRMHQTSTCTPKNIEGSSFCNSWQLLHMKGTTFLSNKIMNFQKSKSSVYQLKRKIFKKAAQQTKKNEISGNQKVSGLTESEKSRKLQIRQKGVKFALSISESFQPSMKSLSTSKAIESKQRKAHEKSTLNFMQTSKAICHLTKVNRLAQYRQKLLQNKKELDEYLKLSFKKLATVLKGTSNSSVSLNQIQAETIDITLQIEQLLNDFNSLLASLKTFCSHSEESFQRQTLISSKIKFAQLIKQKTGHQKLVQIYEQTLCDIVLIKSSQKRIQFKKQILWQLSSHYYSLRQFKKCTSSYLEIARLGEPIGYMKMGEIYMLTQDYSNSVKFLEKYALQKNYDLASKVKLAHAYSKIPQYFIKTIDMLTNILLHCDNIYKFKPQILSREHDDKLIESAVILLSSLYFKNQNIQKAIDLCQNYCKINITNYRVMHILGGYYRYTRNKRKSFQCYLNALENNPSHHKSLIQLTQFICEGHQYKTHAIELLRKCFCIQNRNFQLLKTLIRFIGDQKLCEELKTTTTIHHDTLLKYAQILKQSEQNGYSSEFFYEQASLVYEWALTLLDKNICIVNLDQIQKIYKNLGQISLKAGDYIKSQNFYKIYLVEIQKFISRSNLNDILKSQKVNKTKMQIYYRLGKVKKQQRNYKKAIQFFQKSFDLQRRLSLTIKDLENYFYWFEIGLCYFYLEDYPTAQTKLVQHKNYLLYFIKCYDVHFFESQRQIDFVVPSFLDLKQKDQQQKKPNQLSRINSISNEYHQQNTEQNVQNERIQKLLKRNYFQNQLFIAFCHDKMRKFIQSKETYIKILDFFEQVQGSVEEKNRLKKAGKKAEYKDDYAKARQKTFNKFLSSQNQLNQEYREFKKVCMINLANIYKIEGANNKYKHVIESYVELYPQNPLQKTTQNTSEQNSFTNAEEESQDELKQITEFLCMKFVKKIKVNDCFLRWMNPEILHPVDVVKASTRNKERD